METPDDRDRLFSAALPEDISGLEVMWKIIETLQKEHGAQILTFDCDTERGTAEVVLPRPRPAA